MRDIGIVHKPLLATVAPNRNKPGQVVAFIENQLCFFEPDSLVPAVGETVEVMITRPVHPKDDRFFNFDRLTGLMIRVVDREHHALVAIDGFECSGSMRSEEHTSELQSLMRISYAVFCVKKKNKEVTKAVRENTKQIATDHNNKTTLKTKVT